MTQKQLLAILGFLFAAAWIGFDFGDAILCLVGATIFYAIGSFAQGEFDLTDVQDRLRGAQGSRFAPPPAPAPPPRRSTRPRVR